jgi:hypothetical protein
MTEDREIEERLRRYRPAGPPADLRERSLLAHGRHHDSRSASLQARQVWWQLAAAAALVVAALLLQSATARIDRRIALVTAPAYEADEKRMDDLVRELGGDPSARILAGAILIRERVLERANLSATEIQR